MRKIHRWILFSVALIMIVPAHDIGAQESGVTTPPVSESNPVISGIQIFPANNVWNTPVDALPAQRAIDIINDHGGHNFHADFGTMYNGLYNGIPVNVVSGSATPLVRVTVTTYASESDPVPGGNQNGGFLPIPTNVRIEGDPNTSSTWSAGGDHHLLLIDSDTNTLHELYSVIRQPDGSYVTNHYCHWDLGSNALRPDFWTSGDAAGLPVTPGLVQYEQVAACLAVDPQGTSSNLGHAIRFTLDLTHGPHIWPARHDANSGGTNNPPLGLRVRMKSSFDASGYSPTNRIIINTLKKYGAILTDNGGDWFFQGSPDPRWDDNDLHNLVAIVPATHFEVVDTQHWIVDPDSAEADLNGTGQPPFAFPKAGAVRALDFDDPTHIITATGFTSFPPAVYTAGRGYGWESVSTGIGYRTRSVSTDALWSDITITEFSSTQRFLADVPNGSYSVTLFLGDPEYQSNPGLVVAAEGVTQFTLTNTAAGQQLVRTFPVTVSDGQLTLQFTGSLSIAGLEIDPATPMPELSLASAGTGIDQVVTIQSTGLFRLVFEAEDNWGLSQWYDLLHDSSGLTNLIGPAYGVNQSEITVQEPGLFQQVFYGTTPDDPKLYMRSAKYYFPNSPRSFTILENTPSRIIVEAVSEPVAGSQGVLSNITGTVRYTIYPDGRIYVHSSITAQNPQNIGGWFNSIIGLENPGGLGEVPPDSRGWIRATDTQNPYSWSGDTAKYLFAYWSPQTPAPYTNWSKASVLLVPAANNPSQGKQIIHSWTNFLRWGYGSTGITMSAGQTIAQDYLIQLGTEGSSVLPNIRSSAIADPIANAYLGVTPPPLAPSITTQPANQTVTAPTSATFSVVASGNPSPTYQWQSAPSGSSTFTAISGATSATCTTGATSTALSGTKYRCVATNSGGNATSSAATLTVNAAAVAPTITTQPVNLTVTAPATATFSVVASGSPTPTYQWQSAPSGSSTYTAISGATSASYTTGATSTAISGTKYRCVATNSAGNATSSAATLTVNAAAVAPAFTTQPVNQTVTAPTTATFSVIASGNPTPTYQWQSAPLGSSTYTAISGATSASYTTGATSTAMSGTTYRCVATNSAGSATSTAATLTVNAPSTPTASVAVGDAVISEAGPNPGTFIITLSTAPSTAVTIAYSLTGRARNGGDYVSLPTTATIAAGQTTATVTVTPIDDTKYEKVEAVILTIKSGTGYTVGTPTNATLSIQDNEGLQQTAATVSTSAAPTVGNVVTYTAPTNSEWPSDLNSTWTWGDGSAVATITGGVSADHAFATAGTYTVAVTITDPASAATLRESFSVTVKAAGSGGGGGGQAGGGGGCGGGSGLSCLLMILVILMIPVTRQRGT